jgi:hypothetical protein
MKNKPFSLRIDNPCTEKWSEMRVNDAGKFCSHCQKNVIDFTNCSDDELVAILEKLEGKVCGRLQKNQLERIFVATKNRKVSPHLNKILAGLFALGLVESADLHAQQEHINIKTTWSPDTAQNIVANNSIQNFEKPQQEKKLPAATPYLVSGKIIQSYDSLPINAATIKIKNSTVTAMTDSLGEFSLQIPDSLLSDTITLEFFATGYEMTERKIAKTNFASPVIVTLYYEIFIGEMLQYDPPKEKKKRKK